MYSWVLPETIGERMNWTYRGTLVADSGQILTPADFTDIRMRIYVQGRDTLEVMPDTSIKNVDRGTLIGNQLTIAFTSADSRLMQPSREWESHVALVEFTFWGRRGAKELIWRIKNNPKVS